MNELKHQEITKQIIKAYYHVYNLLGTGFLEVVYRNSLANVLKKMNFKVSTERKISVYFEGEIVGEYSADLVVNEVVIIEIKAVEQLIARHEVQLVNYLKATPIEVGLLMNFGNPEPEFRRRVLSNHRKPHLGNP